jgi:hypothetical protein
MLRQLKIADDFKFGIEAEVLNPAGEQTGVQAYRDMKNG